MVLHNQERTYPPSGTNKIGPEAERLPVRVRTIWIACVVTGAVIMLMSSAISYGYGKYLDRTLVPVTHQQAERLKRDLASEDLTALSDLDALLIEVEGHSVTIMLKNGHTIRKAFDSISMPKGSDVHIRYIEHKDGFRVDLVKKPSPYEFTRDAYIDHAHNALAIALNAVKQSIEYGSTWN